MPSSRARSRAARCAGPISAPNSNPSRPTSPTRWGCSGPRAPSSPSCAAAWRPERAGLEPGDIVVAVNGAPIVDAGSLDYRLATLRIGETAKVEFLRGAERFAADVALEAAPERPAREERVLSGDHPFDGLTVVNLSPAVAEELSIPEASEGDVVVMSVAPDSIAARIGIRRGDVLVAVNGERILDTEDAARFDQVGRDGWVLALERGGRLVQTRIGGQRRRMFRAPF